MCCYLKQDTLFYLPIFIFLCFLQGYCDWKFQAGWEKPSIINPDVIPTPHGRRCTGTKQRATLHWNQVCTSTVVKISLLPSPRGFSTGRLIQHSVSGNNKSWPSTCKEALLGKIEYINDVPLPVEHPRSEGLGRKSPRTQWRFATSGKLWTLSSLKYSALVASTPGVKVGNHLDWHVRN